MNREVSEIQKREFFEFAGIPLPDLKETGNLTTNRPFNKKWENSPWCVSYHFTPSDGRLFCELSHRMTNNRIIGWEQDGTPLSEEVVSKIYPLYL